MFITLSCMPVIRKIHLRRVETGGLKSRHSHGISRLSLRAYGRLCLDCDIQDSYRTEDLPQTEDELLNNCKSALRKVFNLRRADGFRLSNVVTELTLLPSHASLLI